MSRSNLLWHQLGRRATAFLLVTGLLLSPVVGFSTSSHTASASDTIDTMPEPLATAPESQSTIQPNASGAESAFAEQMVILVNQFRAQKGLPPLKVNDALAKAGQDYSTRLGVANFFGHNDPDFGCNKASERAVTAGYTNWSTIGENLAAGYATAESAFKALSESPGHRANMLHENYREIGVGYFFDGNDSANIRQDGACPYTRNTAGPYRHYWSQEFGARYMNGLPYLPMVINGESVSTTQRSISMYVYPGGIGTNAWAKQVRFSADDTNWTAYQEWSTTLTYNLPGGTGIKTVYAQISNGLTTQTVSDTIYLVDGSTTEPTPTPSPFPSPTPNPNPNIKPRAFVPIIRR